MRLTNIYESLKILDPESTQKVKENTLSESVIKKVANKIIPKPTLTKIQSTALSKIKKHIKALKSDTSLTKKQKKIIEIINKVLIKPLNKTKPQNVYNLKKHKAQESPETLFNSSVSRNQKKSKTSAFQATSEPPAIGLISTTGGFSLASHPYEFAISSAEVVDLKPISEPPTSEQKVSITKNSEMKPKPEKAEPDHHNSKIKKIITEDLSKIILVPKDYENISKVSTGELEMLMINLISAIKNCCIDNQLCNTEDEVIHTAINALLMGNASENEKLEKLTKKTTLAEAKNLTEKLQSLKIKKSIANGIYLVTKTKLKLIKLFNEPCSNIHQFKEIKKYIVILDNILKVTTNQPSPNNPSENLTPKDSSALASHKKQVSLPPLDTSSEEGVFLVEILPEKFKDLEPKTIAELEKYTSQLGALATNIQLSDIADLSDGIMKLVINGNSLGLKDVPTNKKIDLMNVAQKLRGQLILLEEESEACTFEIVKNSLGTLILAVDLKELEEIDKFLNVVTELIFSEDKDALKRYLDTAAAELSEEVLSKLQEDPYELESLAIAMRALKVNCLSEQVDIYNLQEELESANEKQLKGMVLELIDKLSEALVKLGKKSSLGQHASELIHRIFHRAERIAKESGRPDEAMALSKMRRSTTLGSARTIFTFSYEDSIKIDLTP